MRSITQKIFDNYLHPNDVKNQEKQLVNLEHSKMVKYKSIEEKGS